MKTGLQHSPGLLARAWLEEGKEVKPEHVDALALEIPIIVVFWRKEKVGMYGHVGLFIRKIERSVWTLGGNQGIGQVNITPYAEYRVLGYRRLTI